MDVLHHNLETVEELRFGILYFGYKVFGQVFVYYTIGGSKKGQHVLNKVALVVSEVFPVFKVLAKVYFFGRPERGFGLLIEFPDIVVLNRE